MARKLAFDVLPMEQWPANDQAAWLRAVTSGGLLGKRGELARYSPEARKGLARAYGRWLGFLRYKRGWSDGDLGQMLEDVDLLIEFIDELGAVAPCSARGYLTDLEIACRGLHPQVDRTHLHRAVRHAWRTAEPVTDKIGRMVTPRELVALGVKLMAEAAMLSTPLQRAARYRDGLMIAMLISAPCRISNFVSLRIDEQLKWDGTCYRIRFHSREVKNSRFTPYALPIGLNTAIRTWLDLHRPVCLAQMGRWHRQHDGKAFWISCDGSPFGRASSVRNRIEHITELRLGRRINPHLFRDIAATGIVSELPDDVGIILDVLSHRSFETGMKHYNQAEMLPPLRAFQDILAGFRGVNAGKDLH